MAYSSVIFKKAETVRVDCDLHTWMRAWVVATDHPFIAVTGPVGEFAIDNVPPVPWPLRATLYIFFSLRLTWSYCMIC